MIFIAITISDNGPSDIVRGNCSIIATSSRPDGVYPTIEIHHRSEHGLHSVLSKANFLVLFCTAYIHWPGRTRLSVYIALPYDKALLLRNVAVIGSWKIKKDE